MTDPNTRRIIGDGLLMQTMATWSTLVPTSACYLFVGSPGEVAIVDPGEDIDRNWDALLDALASVGRPLSAVGTIVSTHMHYDHLGMAQRLRDATGATVALHRVEQSAIDDRGHGEPVIARVGRWGVPVARQGELFDVASARETRPSIRADLLLDDADTIAMGDREATVLFTPGHTRGHICLDLPSDAMMLTGDHVLPSVYPGIGLGDRGATNPLDDYYESLDRVVERGERRGLPGHGPDFPGLADRAARTAEHHRRRGAEIAAALDEAPGTVWELASRLRWSAGWAGLERYSLDSALRQTEMHVESLGRLGELVAG